MTEVVDLDQVPYSKKTRLLRELGYGVEDGYVLEDPDGERRIDPYVEEPVPVDQMMIVPGSTIVLKDTPFSLINYLEDYGDPGNKAT